MSSERSKKRVVSCEEDKEFQAEIDALTNKRSMFAPGECKTIPDPQDKPPAFITEFPQEPAPQGYITDTPMEFERFKDKSRGLFGGYFRSEADFEDFCMLPIAASQRLAFVRRVQALEADKMINKSAVTIHTA